MPRTSVSVDCDDVGFGWFAAGTQIIVAIVCGFLNAWVAFGIVSSVMLGFAAESWRKGKKNGSLR